jgi:DNA-binding NarL/FixJ family response regulator
MLENICFFGVARVHSHPIAALHLQLAEGTVKIHIKALFAKLGVRRRAAVAVAGTRLLSPERGDY